MAYTKAHIQEARGYNSTTIPYLLGPVTITFSPVKAEDLTYSETSSANGYITSFNIEIHYQSGKSLL